MGSANDIQTVLWHRRAVDPDWIAAIRRFDRSPSCSIALASLAPARGQAATGCRGYTSSRAITAQTTRATLLARAIAATLRGRRSSNCSSQALAERINDQTAHFHFLHKVGRTQNIGAHGQGGLPREEGWEPSGVYCGIYDSAHTTVWETLCRVEWLSRIVKLN